MIEKRLKVMDSSGLHMRPAGDLCRLAMKYDCAIRIQFRGKEFNAKSLLSVLSACVQQQDEIVLVCDGQDEAEALQAIAAFIEEGQESIPG